mmetsp:Transcript_11474/g.15479  ORF Transcript_11474/g.15479 Transcript_11474/m.15479 type:complete len:151 (-) Transcript_11474:232-684(-)
MNEKDFKNEKRLSDVYYFNVDLKFVLKARMHLLRKSFESKISEARLHGNKYQCSSCGDETQYNLVVANSMQMKCNNCRQDLEEVKENNKLSEEDQKKCSAAIDNIIKQLKLFDDFVVPASFFGPGAMNAYVSMSSNQHMEDQNNVHFDLR